MYIRPKKAENKNVWKWITWQEEEEAGEEDREEYKQVNMQLILKKEKSSPIDR